MKKGFTLIELLVVVLIIGILAAVALPQYEKAVQKTRLINHARLLMDVYRAQEIYKLANGEYALRLSELDITLPCTGVTEAVEGDYCNLPDGAVLKVFNRNGGYIKYGEYSVSYEARLNRALGVRCKGRSPKGIALCRSVGEPTETEEHFKMWDL